MPVSDDYFRENDKSCVNIYILLSYLLSYLLTYLLTYCFNIRLSQSQMDRVEGVALLFWVVSARVTAVGRVTKNTTHVHYEKKSN